MTTLTDNDLFELAEACLMYEKEYEEAENTIVMPTLEEIKDQCVRVKAKLIAELVVVEKVLSNKIMLAASVLSTHEWNSLGERLRSLKRNLDNYDIDLMAGRLHNTARSIKFCSEDCYELQPSWYYTDVMKVLSKVPET